MCNTMERVILAAAILVGTTGRAAAGFIVDFDDVTAPAAFDDVTPGGAEGPTFIRSGITFTDGVVLNDSGYGSNATSGTNFYATKESYLSGDIRADFSASLGVTEVTLDVVNRSYEGATYTLSAFGATGELIASRRIDLSPVPTHYYPIDGSVGTVSVAGYGIAGFRVTSSLWGFFGADFAIDTVRLSTDIPPRLLIPEPSSLTLCAAASLTGLGVLARRHRLA